MTEQTRLEVSDPQIMRALAHPARLSIMDYFLAGQTGTATELAEVVGLSPSATSYHLRALARYGLVEEAPSRGDGRERVWQTRTVGMTVDGDPDQSQEPPEWAKAATFSEGLLMLTAEELTELTAAVHELFRTYSRARRTDPPPGARQVSAVFRAFPVG